MLMRARLFHLPELDAQLVRMISSGRASLASDLAIHLIRTCLVSDPIVTAADLFNTLDTLAKVARHTSNGSQVLVLVEQARQVTRSDIAHATHPSLVRIVCDAFRACASLCHVCIACHLLQTLLYGRSLPLKVHQSNVCMGWIGTGGKA